MSSRPPSRGLPTNPRPRSKSAATPGRQTASTTQPRPALRSNPRARPALPTQRDIGSDAAVKSASSRRVRNDSPLRTVENLYYSRASDDSSVDSSSSSGSSFWSKGKALSSAASSRTDLRRDNDGSDLNQNNGNSKRNITNSGATESEAHIDAKELAGLAWGRVAGVANVFTQEVSKVWANGLTPLGGHTDQTGHQAEEESHLLRVMRNYHLSKARTPSDLPDWLFSAKERGQSGGALRSEVHSDDSRSAQHRDDSDSDFGNNSKPSELRRIARPLPGSRLPTGKSVGASRLKMIRDNKRAIPSGNRV